ncbi:MAG: folate family ECF transporter S component [Ruminococcus sp.]|nr:folate family ECF transporter S component [Ruminococcus sp.]
MDKNSKFGTELRLFRSTKVLAASSLMIAMSIVLGKLLAINIGDSIRISFENLPIMVSGFFFGPAIGMAVGAGADIVGCLIVGYSINPIITVGAASIGFFSGLIARDSKVSNKLLKAYSSVGIAHVVGSMLIKSFGMRVYFHTPFSVLALRIPLYLAITVAEGYVIYLLSRSKVFMSQLERVTKK